MELSRRDFIKASLGGLAYISATAAVPVWVAKSAHGLGAGQFDDRILVLVQMGGGNDGLNTVIPYEDDRYYNARPKLGVQDGFHRLGDGLNALHPRMGDLKSWYDDGHMAVLQNVGYPNPNLSHFLSTDYYEYGASPGSVTAPEGAGWVARFFDNACAGVAPEDIPALSILALNTSELPNTLDGSESYLPARVSNLGDFTLRAGSELRAQYLRNLNRLNVPNSDLDYIQRVENVVEGTVQEFSQANETADLRNYPSGRLGNGMKNISKLIRSGRQTKIYYCSQGGYDTHANQSGGNPNFGQHADLLGEFNGAVNSFLSDMRDSGNLHKVLLLTFSEFGRRIGENGSSGTDHGGASCLMAFGGGVVGGVYGGQPDLRSNSLIRGNLAHKVDFRAIYSNVIQDWFGEDPEAVFGADFNDPIFNIPAGMDMAPFVNLNPSPTVNNPGGGGEGEGEGEGEGSGGGGLGGGLPAGCAMP